MVSFFHYIITYGGVNILRCRHSIRVTSLNTAFSGSIPDRIGIKKYFCPRLGGMVEQNLQRVKSQIPPPACDVNAYVHLIAILPLDGDFKSGGHLGASRKEKDNARSRFSPLPFLTTFITPQYDIYTHSFQTLSRPYFCQLLCNLAR